MKPNPALKQALENLTGVSKPEPVEPKPVDVKPETVDRKSKVPVHRETASEHVDRVRRELQVEREKIASERAEREAKAPKYTPTREEELQGGYVRAKARRGPNREFQMFTLREWQAMSSAERMGYMVEVTNDSANKYNFQTTGRTGKGRGTLVLSSLSHPRRY